MSAQLVIATQRHIAVPNVKIILRDLPKYGSAPDEAIMILDALAHLEQISDTNSASVLRNVAMRLKLKEYKVDLNQLAESSLVDLPRTRAMVGLLGNLTGLLSNDWRDRLQASINPMTTFKLALTGLPVPREQLLTWHIRE